MNKLRPYLLFVAIAAFCLPKVQGEVTSQDLLDATKQPANWLLYHGDYAGQRYSNLTAIDRSNVHSLKLQWAFQEKFEVTPLVVDGIMYITVPPGAV